MRKNQNSGRERPVQLSLYVQPDEKAVVIAAAKAAGVSVARFLRRLVILALPGHLALSPDLVEAVRRVIAEMKARGEI